MKLQVSTKRKRFNKFVASKLSLLIITVQDLVYCPRKVLIGKLMPQYGLIASSSLIEDKRNAEGTQSSEPQKAHPTGEFVIVA